MRNEQKSQIQTYVEGLLAPAGVAEQSARTFSQQLGREGISLSDMEAEILRFLIGVHRPQKILEIGTLTGLTALKMATSMGTHAQLWTLEKSAEHGTLAQKSFDLLPETLRSRVHLILGDARETLQNVKGQGPFDFVFIDGNKAAYLEYAQWCEANMPAGGVIVADNVFLGGKVFQEVSAWDKQTKVMDQFNRFFIQNSNWKASILPTTEGMLVAYKAN